MAADGPLRLTLYSRKGCHLCDEMALELRALKRAHSFVFDVVDVDASPELVGRYGDRVPVLAYGASELCHGRIQRAAVTAFLAQFR